MKYISAFFTWINSWVTTFSSTNWKIATGMFMSVATMFFYFGSEMHCIWGITYSEKVLSSSCRPIDSTNFGLWLAFVAAWAGISYAQFAKKRSTYASPSPDSKRADVPDSPSPTKATERKEDLETGGA